MAYAWRHDMEFTLPATTTPGRDPVANPVYLPHLVNPRFNPRLSPFQINEQQHSFVELPFNDGWRHCNIVLNGYWQSEKYFMDFRQRILDAFAFPWVPRPGVVSVHVRRGDYLRLPQKHPAVPVEWIESAMAEFPGYKFLFFSDELDWCRKTFGHRDDCSFSQGKDEIDDLVGGSCCEHHVCSSSTFSWFQVWLSQNPDTRAIFPKLWFVKGWGGLATHDIIPDRWEKL
jgi:hypothetical protein